MTIIEQNKPPALWRYRIALISGCVIGLIISFEGFVDPASPADDLARWPFMAQVIYVASLCTVMAAFAMFIVFARNFVIQAVLDRTKAQRRTPPKPAPIR
jgi:hypothetical protein